MSAFARRKSTSTASYLGSRSALIVSALLSELLGSSGIFFVPSAGSKAARVMLGLRSFCSKGLELRGELGGVLDSFSILDAFDVALVRVLV